jgi:HSP20 family protein
MITVNSSTGRVAVLAARQRMQVEAISWQVRVQQPIWTPPTDLYETEFVYIVRVEIAGMRAQDFSVNLEHNELTISGARSATPERRAYHQMEVRSGAFSTGATLPGPVELSASRAEYDDGFLTVTLPKVTPSQISSKE